MQTNTDNPSDTNEPTPPDVLPGLRPVRAVPVMMGTAYASPGAVGSTDLLEWIVPARANLRSWEDARQRRIGEVNGGLVSDGKVETVMRWNDTLGARVGELDLDRKTREVLWDECAREGMLYVGAVEGVEHSAAKYLVRRFGRGGESHDVYISPPFDAILLSERERENVRAFTDNADVPGQGRMFPDVVPPPDALTLYRARVRSDVQLAEDCERLGDALVRVFGVHRVNPFRVSAETLRFAVAPHVERRAAQERVERALSALNKTRIIVKFLYTQDGKPSKDKGGSVSHILQYSWVGGVGVGSEAEYTIDLSDSMIYPMRLPDSATSRYQFNRDDVKNRPLDVRRAEGHVLRAARGWTPSDTRAYDILTNYLTESEGDSRKLRECGRDFCELLPADRVFYVAMGNYKHATAAGRGLLLVAAGRRADPLLHRIMRRQLRTSKGAARLAYYTEGMRCIRRVMDSVGGVIAAKDGDRWMSVDEAETLGVDARLMHVRWFFFFPTDYEDRVASIIDTAGRERVASGKSASAMVAVRDADEYRKLIDESANPVRYDRLIEKRKAAGLSVSQCAAMFGVAQPHWTAYEKPPGVKGRRAVPMMRVPLVLRWLDTGQVPTPDELAAVKRSAKK